MVWSGVISLWDRVGRGWLCSGEAVLPWDLAVELMHLQLTFLGGSCQKNLLLQRDLCIRSCECGPAEGSWVVLELVLGGCRGNSGLILQHGMLEQEWGMDGWMDAGG